MADRRPTIGYSNFNWLKFLDGKFLQGDPGFRSQDLFYPPQAIGRAGEPEAEKDLLAVWNAMAIEQAVAGFDDHRIIFNIGIYRAAPLVNERFGIGGKEV